MCSALRALRRGPTAAPGLLGDLDRALRPFLVSSPAVLRAFGANGSSNAGNERGSTCCAKLTAASAACFTVDSTVLRVYFPYGVRGGRGVLEAIADETHGLRFDDGAFLDEGLEHVASFGLHPVAGDDGRAQACEPYLTRRH